MPYFRARGPAPASQSQKNQETRKCHHDLITRDWTEEAFCVIVRSIVNFALEHLPTRVCTVLCISTVVAFVDGIIAAPVLALP